MNPKSTQPGRAAIIRAVIYTRVSLDKKRKMRSVTEQETDAREVCDEEDWHLVRVFCDNSLSASRFARKARDEYEELLAFLHAGEADVLILWEPSRGDREIERWIQLLKLCRKNSILIHIVSHEQTYDMGKPKDFKNLANEGVDSAYESDKTSLRLQRTMRSAAKAGRPHGRPLYGYKRVYDVDTGEMIGQIIDEEKAEIVREAARRIAGGESAYAVAEDFQKRCIPTPGMGKKGWDPTMITRMVVKDAYVAKRVHQKKVVGSGDWKPILDEKTFAICKKRLGDPARRTNRDRSLKHLASGAGRCGVCETPTYFSKIRAQKNRTYQTYICDDHFCIAIKTDWLDEYLEDVIVERMSRSDARDILSRPRKVAETKGEELQELIQEKKVLLQSWYDAAAEGKISPNGLAEIESKLLPEIEVLGARLRSLVISPLLLDLACAKPRDVWERWDIAMRREALGLLMIVRVMKTNRGARTFDPNRVKIEWLNKALA
jgi:DNA invertase Pin-like site-specific DNA recombinase